jgi:hypothetical protein
VVVELRRQDHLVTMVQIQFLVQLHQQVVEQEQDLEKLMIHNQQVVQVVVQQEEEHQVVDLILEQMVTLLQ